MRKPLLALFLALSLTLGLAACGSTPAPEADNAASDSAPSESTPQTEASGGVLVAYFSATGNTEGVAQQLAGLLSADLYAITPAEPYTEEDLDYTNPNSRSQVEGSDPDARPALAGPQGHSGHRPAPLPPPLLRVGAYRVHPLLSQERRHLLPHRLKIQVFSPSRLLCLRLSVLHRQQGPPVQRLLPHADGLGRPHRKAQPVPLHAQAVRFLQ